MSLTRIALTSVSLCAQALYAETSPGAIIAVGYAPPSLAATAAPGQVIALSVYGVESRFPRPVIATDFPLPITLGGLSVKLSWLGTSTAVPLLAVQQTQCGPLQPEPCAVLTTISVQIPFEAVEECLLCGRLSIPSFLSVSENSVPRAAAQLVVPGDSIHIVSTCDTTALPFRIGGEPCGKVVTHADGSLVSLSNSARPGETLVMYAFGLGRTDPPVKSGEATPSPGAPIVDVNRFTVSFDYSRNALPVRPVNSGLPPSPWFDVSAFVQRPLYAGLVAGFAGLYQINFRLPDTKPPATCASSAGISSNLTVTVSSRWSFDGVGICLAAEK